MERNKHNFYNILFDGDDYISIKNRKLVNGEFIFIKGECGVPHLSSGMPAEFICINPVDIASDGAAKNSNIFVYRNILFEEDDTTIEEQRRKITQSAMPYSTVVYSGNTSAHHIVSLRDPLKDEDEYRRWFKAIEQVLSQYKFTADSACKNPSRLSRAAEGINLSTGVTQEILELRSRVQNEELLKWMQDHGVHPNDYIPKDIEYTAVNGPNTANEEQRWKVAKLLMGKDFDYSGLGDGQREPARFQLTLRCKECGLDLPTTQRNIDKEFPSSKGSNKLFADVKRTWETREVTQRNVMSTEDWIKLEDLKKKEDVSLQFDNLLNMEYNLDPEEEVPDERILEDTDGELHRYIMVGNEIYFIANRRLYKRNLQTFTLQFPKRELLNVRRFTDFCNEPGYFNYEPVVNNHYNSFKIPTWKPKKGDWETIEHYLKHISGHQYEMMLDYFQISLQSPKQKLPILLLMSYDKGTGKSTFFDLLHSCFGENVESVDPKQFEMEWNTQWCEKHFVFVDEMEKIKDTDAIGTKLKKLAYFPKISKNKKGFDTESIPWNGRIVLTSNEEGGFIDIDDEEDRFWVLKVPKRESYSDQYVDNLRRETPYFIHHLMNRELSTKNENRGWFSKELLKTKALEDIVHNSRPQIDIDVEHAISDWFGENKKENECNFILDGLNLKLTKSYSDKELREVIHKIWGVTASKRRTLPDSFNNNTKKQKFWYTIPRVSVVTNDDLNDAIASSFDEFVN